MSKFLFVVPPFFGHISSLLTLGAHLLSKGHEVVWTGLTPLNEELLPDKELYWHMQPEWDTHYDEINRILDLQDSGASMSVYEAAVLAVEGTAIPFCRIMLSGVQRAIDTWKPDVIVNDCLAFAGGLAAYLNNIPYATTVPVPADVVGSKFEMNNLLEWHMRHIIGMQKEYGVMEERRIVHSETLAISFTSLSFSGIPDIPSYAKFVGPISGLPYEVPFDWDTFNASRMPKVYVTIGTLLKDIRKDFFIRIVNEFGNKPVTVVAATDPELLESWPDNFIVQKFVPQAEVIKHSDLVVCHGGFNTVNDTLLNGIPILVVPIAYDQFHTANLIKRAGCGVSLKYKRLRKGELGNALDELLGNPTYKEAALAVRETFIEAGGCDKAVEYLEQLCTR